jgi:hypothetical protein
MQYAHMYYFHITATDKKSSIFRIDFHRLLLLPPAAASAAAAVLTTLVILIVSPG